MVRPLLLILLGTVIVSLVLGSRTPGEPLHLVEIDQSHSQVTLGGEPLRDLVPLSIIAIRQAEQPLKSLRMTQVHAIRKEGQQSVLVFDDGSELAVTANVLASLPHDMKLRLSYER